MHLQNSLAEIAEYGITLTYERAEDRLIARPTIALTPELVAEIKEHKTEIIEIMRKDERRREDRVLEETSHIQSERQVFEMAREFFGQRGREGAA
jgi:hypothetical protein